MHKTKQLFPEEIFAHKLTPETLLFTLFCRPLYIAP